MLIIGKTIQLRNILIKDSKFINAIRRKRNVSRYLNNPPINLNHQIKWMKKNIKNKGTKDFVILNL